VVTGATLSFLPFPTVRTCAPVTKQTAAVLRAWLRETTDRPGSPLFPSRDGGTLTRDAIERRLAQHVNTAQQACVSLRSKLVTMHTLRHTAAMNLLTAGVDTSTIALWLGHEQERTTHIYLHPTSSTSSAPWTGSRLLMAAQAATEHPTLCSPSSRASSRPALPLRARKRARHRQPATRSRFVQRRCLAPSASDASLQRIAERRPSE
jgi:hypothetical protein